MVRFVKTLIKAFNAYGYIMMGSTKTCPPTKSKQTRFKKNAI